VAPEKIDIADKAENSGARIEKPAMPTQPISVNYPRRARRAGLEGDVTLSVLVGVDGAVKAVDVISGTGFDVLDNAAEKAIWNARFTPATIDGIAVEASVSQVVSFRLRD
jgi:protein TonB